MKVRGRLVEKPEAARCKFDGRDYAAPLMSESTKIFQALSSHSGM